MIEPYDVYDDNDHDDHAPGQPGQHEHNDDQDHDDGPPADHLEIRTRNHCETIWAPEVALLQARFPQGFPALSGSF